MAAASALAMRISALSSILVLGMLATLAVPAQAEPEAAHAATSPVAVLSKAPHPERIAPAPTTSDLALSGRPSVAHKEPFLSAGDVTTLVAPHAPELKQCYLDAISASQPPGHLDLTFVIAREGYVLSLHAAAAGMPARTAHKVEDCIRTAVDGLQFPARRNDTTVIIPYFFQKTVSPNAGPQQSCWNPKGC
jgi:hypothetical protein